MKDNKSMIVKIENEFVMKAHYSLSAIEQKIVLHLASRINPLEDEEFHKQIVSIKELEQILSSKTTKRWGSVYTYLENVCDSLLSHTIRFPEPIVLNNKTKIIKGGINLFQHIFITENEQKEKSIEFKFSDMMKPFLLELNMYVRLNALEAIDLDGKHAIRMYQVFKAERERTKKHKKVSTLEYEVAELKSFLGIKDKYKVLAGLRRRVLEPLVDEINISSHEIRVGFEYIKKRNKVIGIKFLIKDAPNKPKKLPKFKDYVPNEEDVAKLTNAQNIAYFSLVDYGVIAGIAYKQILPSIKAGDILGFEDIFIKNALEYFEKGTTHQKKAAKVGAFVKWWTETGVFDAKGDVYWKIHEKTYNFKKAISPEKKENRELAKNITKSEFYKIMTSK